MLYGLKKLNRFDKQEYGFLAPYNSSIPQLYGLPKIHKPAIPMRIIVDFRYSAFYNLAKYEAGILQVVASGHTTTLRNSYQIAEELKTLVIPPGYHMVSFDVVSLFTNVPIQDTLLYIEDCMKNNQNWKSKTKLSLQEFMRLLNLTMKNNYFIWKKNVYRQKTGTPMGSPVSPVFAELFLQKLENSLVKGNSNIHFWRRLVDDVFAVIPYDKTTSILDELNSFHPAIQFTIEEESNHTLPFLDVLATRDDNGNIHRNVYRKKTHSGRYLNFDSYHPMCHKLSVIDSLSFRAFIICDTEFLQSELDEIRRQLVRNGYPHRLITERFQRMELRASQWTIHRNLINEEDRKIRIILPYMGPITTRITCYLRVKLDCNFGFHPGQKLNSLLNNAKEKRTRQSYGIYKLTCSCKSTYVGETKRSIEQRDYEHHHQLTSAVNDHLNEFPSHHVVSASLIERENRTFHRKFKEHLWIIKCGDMNRNNGQHINSIWTATLIPLLEH
ncbi:unnamed protein product [Orchesella dallaii]|uniref:Reverse transcriptase domain-containing protein n=1 Tax=Orchesella dallaii TaxID=48710 RepID=A0ABP1RIA7_9HEXA